jgi:hypothetical protein
MACPVLLVDHACGTHGHDRVGVDHDSLLQQRRFELVDRVRHPQRDLLRSGLTDKRLFGLPVDHPPVETLLMDHAGKGRADFAKLIAELLKPVLIAADDLRVVARA